MNYFLDFDYKGKRKRKPHKPHPILWVIAACACVLFIAWTVLGNILYRRVRATDGLLGYVGVVVEEEEEPIYANYNRKNVIRGMRLTSLKTRYNNEGLLELIPDPDCVGMSDYLTVPPTEIRDSKENLPVTAVMPMSESVMLAAPQLAELGYSEILFLAEAGTLDEATTNTLCLLLYNVRAAGCTLPIGLSLYPSVYESAESAKYLETLAAQADFLAVRARTITPNELQEFLRDLKTCIDFYELRILVNAGCEGYMRLSGCADWQIVNG